MYSMRLRRMGLSCKVFIINEDDTVRRIPYALYERLVKGESAERSQGYAGKRVRCAVVWVEIMKRRPLRIYDIDYILLPFNNKGRIDISEWERKRKVGMELEAARIKEFLSSVLKKERKSNLIEAQHRFLKKRYDHEFTWKPNRNIKEEILTYLFGKRKF
jgi:hypothetical protein